MTILFDLEQEQSEKMPWGGKFSSPSAGALPWLSARDLPQSHVKPRGGTEAMAQHTVHGDRTRTHCWLLGMASPAPGCLWKLLHTKPTGLEQSARASGWFCVCWNSQLPHHHYWIYHLWTVLQKGWIACVVLTNHPCVTLTHLSRSE